MNPESTETKNSTPENYAIDIRYLAKEEMFITDQIAELDGRNPGLCDGEFMFNADPKGFIAAIHESQVIGTISLVNYENNLGFIGLHIVVPHLKGNGIEEKLLSIAVRNAGERDLGLNCKIEDKGLYEEAGFKEAFKIITYEGQSDGELNVADNIKSPFSFSFDGLYSYYKSIFPYNRKPFTSFWLNQPKSLLLGKYIDDECKGVGLFKPCKKGYRLSPLISDDIQSARELLVGLSSHFPAGTPYYLDMPEANSDAIDLADDMGLKKVNETLRMYKGKEHEILLDRCYSFTSLEVG